MADYQSVSQPTIISNIISDNSIAYNSIMYNSPNSTELNDGSVVVVDTPIVGAYTNNAVAVQPSIHKQSSNQPSFRDDLYNRIYITPDEIDVGSLLSDREYTVNVWNAYFEEKDFTSLSNENGADCPIVAGDTPPQTYNPLEENSFTISVPISGSPTINTKYSFGFGSEIVSVSITGRRIVLFSFLPEIPYSETNEWLTNIQTSTTGKEIRSGLRAAPRKAVSFDIRAVSIDEKNYLDNMITAWQAEAFGVPMWGELVVLQNDVLSSGKALSVDTSNTSLEAGGLAVIWADYNDFQVVDIESIDENGINTPIEIGKDFSAGAFVVPVYIAHASSSASMREYVSESVDMAIDFELTDNKKITTFTPGLEYKGKPVFVDSSITDDFSRTHKLSSQSERIDKNIGPFRLFNLRDFNFRSYTHGVVARSRSEIWAFREFLHWVNGSQKSFYVSTMNNSMTLIEDVLINGLSLKVKKAGLASFIKDSKTRKTIIINTDTGQHITDISNIIEHDNYEEIVITDSYPNVINKNSCRISFLVVVRMLNEKIKFEWNSPEYIEAKLSLVEVDN